jgi:redox-sensitive bicupin YhaK (pirin superfamily)
MHGFQLWVNLPRRDKMMTPRYQEVRGEKIPSCREPDGRVRVKVLAGESLGARAVIDTRNADPLSSTSRSSPGRASRNRFPSDFNVFGYVVSGAGLFRPRTHARARLAKTSFSSERRRRRRSLATPEGPVSPPLSSADLRSASPSPDTDPSS